MNVMVVFNDNTKKIFIDIDNIKINGRGFLVLNSGEFNGYIPINYVRFYGPLDMWHSDLKSGTVVGKNVVCK